jgi:hypothetical protein
MAHAVRYPMPNVRSRDLADGPFFAVVMPHPGSRQVVSGVRVLSPGVVPAVTLSLGR